ncbi:acylphosphatase [Mannheimia granulomatis]|uniref:acylphosphatase n=1 Tax=Mannheimia granulomatis TaxID=85402 RepID=UPI00047DA316|nr:acylphosphatase [Mannheimia granulomatis]QLB18340.1 acylphosphatase [Mannheimia granulomatis]
MAIKLFSIYGRVQGVAFRFFTRQEAQRLGVKGYTRNRDDGSVEVVAEANDEIMTEFEKWLYKGSPSARVERVVATDYLGTEIFKRFEIRR